MWPFNQCNGGLLSGNAIAAAVARQRKYNALRMDCEMECASDDYRGAPDRPLSWWKRLRLWRLERQPRIWIDDFDPNTEGRTAKLNPNSYNLTLHPELRVYDVKPFPAEQFDGTHTKAWFNDAIQPYLLDMYKDNPTRTLTIPEEGLTLLPGRLYLGRTVEHTEAYNLVPNLDGRSSIGRLGIFVHCTAGRGDNGFCGTWTCEITVVHPLTVRPYAPICQISYNTIDRGGPTYKGRYQRSTGVAASRLFLDQQQEETDHDNGKLTTATTGR